MSLTKIALVGNPNSGKTSLFNKLTGSRQHVGNWPGVTVDKKTGYYTYKQQRVDVIDLPGTYAVESQQTGVSQDELVVRNFVLSDEDCLIVNIIDATNLQRNLYLTTQLLDLNRPMIVVLNMIDALDKSGEKIDLEALEIQLGCPVVAVSAKRGTNIDKLLLIIENGLKHPERPQPKMKMLNEPQEQLVELFLSTLPADSKIHQFTRWQLFELLLGFVDESDFTAEERRELVDCREKLGRFCGGELDIVLASSRYDAIDVLSRSVLERPREASKSLTKRFDKLALGRIMGIPVFLAVMYLMFMLSINVGSAFIDFFDILMGTVLVDGTKHVLDGTGAPDWLVTVLADGVGGGIQTVSTFIPVIAAMFLCLSFLEDSGYLARAAVIVDRGMRSIGLPGKAFVPMLVGFGCNVPAIMGTRTLESSRDRLMSIMMIPYMSCGARLPVYALFAAVFFPTNGQNVVFLLYLFGIAVAVFTGLALKHTILPGNATPFIMELPAYRMPTMRNLLTLTWEKLKSFIIRAGKAIVIMVVALSLLNSLGTDGTFGNEDTDKSVLANIGKTITPAFTPMGVQEHNWPATVGIFTGIFAKEAVIGTLNALYSSMGDDSEGEEDEPYDLMKGVQEAFASIPENLAGLADSFADPLGISGTMADGDLDTVKEENEIDDNTITQMHIAFGTSSAAIAYLIFILLYTPCAAALGAVYREAGAKWTIAVAVWTFVIGWVCATAYYQASLLGTAPAQATGWLIGLAVTLVVIFFVLRVAGRSVTGDMKLPEPKAATGKGCH
jgi:ferrous iron transport protein B